MRMSDIIEQFIKDMLEQSERDEIEFQRNELAQKFNCVPSQINYVISTRFKPTQGYYVESRRGGGGSIIIKKRLLNDDIFLDFTENIGDSISQMDSEIMISNLLSYGLLDEEQSRLLRVATSDNVLKLENNIKDQVRARILKNMLINMDWRN